LCLGCRRLWEIAENLHRADLTEAERRQHIAEWVKLTAEKVLSGATPLLGGAPKSMGYGRHHRRADINYDRPIGPLGMKFRVTM
jgi:hypothetical protein